MNNDVCVSRGVFLSKNGFKRKKSQKKSQKINKDESTNIFSAKPWYQSYKALWQLIQTNIEELNEKMFSGILHDLITHIKNCPVKKNTEIPTCVLLTGINMPDHATQFFTLSNEIKKSVTPHVVVLKSQDCPNMKSLVERMVLQIVVEGTENVSEDDEENNTDESKKGKIKKQECTFSFLSSWYKSNVSKVKSEHKVVLIIPEFESFNINLLQSLIQILSSYATTIPFVLVFGVATSVSALHRSLPYNVSSKLNLQVFKSQSSTIYLNNVLENIIFLQDCPFHLGGKLFALFTDIFLFYDFSVTGFIQNFKYAMLEHFSTSNAMALCTKENKLKHHLQKFEHADYESVRQLYSFRRLVESETWEIQIKLLEDDKYLQAVIHSEILKIENYSNMMNVLLKCLKVLVADLPRTPLGKQVREFYTLAVTKEIASTPEFKETFQLLRFLSKQELLLKMKNVCKIMQDNESCHYEIKDILANILRLTNVINAENSACDDVEIAGEETATKNEYVSRMELKEGLMCKIKQNQVINNYENQKNDLINYITFIFTKYLPLPTSFTFHEIFFFSDVSVQNNIIGSHRAAIHSSLNDPVLYLQCNCCDILNETAILTTMPKICIAYKLHLEYGKKINLYDWLQAFLSILDPLDMNDDDDVENREVDPYLQACFTQCVSELEFLGFIKSSKRKTDHVSRLTWGG